MTVDLVVGETVCSPSKTLTDAHFLFFSGLTGDSHPIHYDVEYAKGRSFGRPVAHGLLMASMTAAGASAFLSRMDGFIFVEQGCRFLRPAFVGDTITPRLTVERIWSEDGRTYVRLKSAITNQHDDTLLDGFQLYAVKDKETR
ncbi:MAG TPA: MaoC/PaaZ C-terminal domain-containing protein [Rhodopila sp.]|jgi:acyl dehydratase|nr:MaoC/PaaZ C-terminal domain-containing protein [Rhodopila sp.]